MILKLSWFHHSTKVVLNRIIFEILNYLSNFKPISILTTFLKIHEKLTKRQIDAAMNKYLSPFISALLVRGIDGRSRK